MLHSAFHPVQEMNVPPNLRTTPACVHCETGSQRLSPTKTQSFQSVPSRTGASEPSEPASAPRGRIRPIASRTAAPDSATICHPALAHSAPRLDCVPALLPFHRPADARVEPESTATPSHGRAIRSKDITATVLRPRTPRTHHHADSPEAFTTS